LPQYTTERDEKNESMERDRKEKREEGEWIGENMSQLSERKCMSEKDKPQHHTNEHQN
jgi:hypothetical protein